MSDDLVCPHCGKSIAITDAISNQLQKELEHKFDLEKKRIEDSHLKQLEQKELEIRKEMWAKAKAAADKLQEETVKKQSIELSDLKTQLDEHKKKNEEMIQQELEMRKKLREVEEMKKNLELQKQRELDEERVKIQKQAEEEHRLKELEKDKTINDLKKLLDEARRKSQQGSQQMQGEVLELDLEQNLRTVFSQDRIEAVAKGAHGADIVQTVCNPNGSSCGVILWEIKQTKNWVDGWVSKLKDDLRAQKANLPVIISIVLPKEIEGFGKYKGVWVATPAFAIQMATVLRTVLVNAAFERNAAMNKGDKADLLFNYVSSHEFRQRVEALVEVYTEMQSQITRERMSYEKLWKQREAQMQRLFVNTAGMYGEMQGLVGSTMPEIKGLEIEEKIQLGDGEKDERALF